jgi:hypothetical protein
MPNAMDSFSPRSGPFAARKADPRKVTLLSFARNDKVLFCKGLTGKNRQGGIFYDPPVSGPRGGAQWH